MSRKKFQKKDDKKSKNYLFEEVLKVLEKNKRKPLNYKQVAAALNITDHSQRLLVNAILDELKGKELAEEADRGKFKLTSTEIFITGKVDMIASGAAYIISEESDDDVYVPAKSMNSAVHGDIVKVSVQKSRDGRKPEGAVVEVVKRGKLEVVGTIQLSARFAFLIPDSNKLVYDVYIPLERLNGAKDGQKAIAKITQWPRTGGNPIGEVKEILGNAGENDTEIHAILAEFGLPYHFPKDVEKMTDHIPLEITEAEIKKRKDFRGTTTFTIDPVDAKDFDDALSFKKLPNGNYEIGVHIADVSHYVKTDSIIDVEAQQRATSVYLVDRVVPMLPEVLSNNVCSLRPNEDKLCFAAVFELDEEANVLEQWFGRTIIHSNRRFTYEEAQEVIETGNGDLREEILTLDKLAKKLRAERMRKGSVAFDKQEVKFNLDETGNPTGVFFKQQKDSNKLIEDFMLLANRKVAEFVGKRGTGGKGQGAGDDVRMKNTEPRKPFVYRIHDRPNPEKLATFSQFVGKLGYKLDIQSDKAIVSSMNKLLSDVEGKTEGNAISLLAIRTMAKAVYTTKNIGHYGLGFEYYTHFTSPIRRYPDVMVHRLLQHYLDGGKPVDAEALELQCKHSSEMEKLAADAERASIKYKQVQFLTDKVGQQFDGIVSGVTEWGMFVEIIENHCEGLVRLRDMKDDMYYFDEENYCIVGKRHKRKFTLGDRVRIEVKRADLVKKQLDFAIAEELYSKSKREAPSSERFEKSRERKFSSKNNQEKDKGRSEKKGDKPKGKNINDEWGFEI